MTLPPRPRPILVASLATLVAAALPAAARAASSSPREVTAVAELSALDRSIDDGIAIVQRFAPLPLVREGVKQMLAARLGLSPEQARAFEGGRSTFLVVLAGSGADDLPMPVLPVRSSAEFLKAAGASMLRLSPQHGLEGFAAKDDPSRRLYVGFVGGGRWAVATTRPERFGSLRGFLEGLVAGRPAAQDLRVTFFVDHLPAEVRAQARVAYGKVWEEIGRQISLQPRAKGSSDPGLALRSARPFYDYYFSLLLDGAELVELSVDLSREDAALALRVSGRPGSQLENVVARQRTGDPALFALLPRGAMASGGLRGNGPGAQESAAMMRGMLEAWFGKGPSRAMRKELAAALDALSGLLGGDLAFAVSPSKRGGLAMLMAVEPQAGASAEGCSAWTRLYTHRAATAGLKSMGYRGPAKATPFTAGGLRGVSVEIPFAPAGSPQEEKMRAEMFGGDRARFACASLEAGGAARWIWAMGRAPREELEQLAAAAARPPGADPAMAAALGRDAAGRVFVAHVSIIELMRFVSAMGVTPVPLNLPPGGGPGLVLSLHVEPATRAARLTLRVPVAHLAQVAKAAQAAGGPPAP